MERNDNRSRGVASSLSARLVAVLVAFSVAGSCWHNLAAVVVSTPDTNDEPLEIVVFEHTDACSAYLPNNVTTNTDNAIEAVPLPSSESLAECTGYAASWRSPGDDSRHARCRTACWYHPQIINGTNENQKKHHHQHNNNNSNCFGLVDPIWMPREAPPPGADSARLVWACRTDGDCSFNGRCHKDGRCQCSQGWKGRYCGELDLLPVDGTVLGFRETDAFGRNVSTWGAPVLFDESTQTWHGFVSELRDGCGINAWITNSRIVRIESAATPLGPFARKEVVWEAFAHEPSVVRGPGGEWVMLFSSYIYNATDYAAVACRNCANGVTPEVNPECPFQRGEPKNLSHPFRQMLSVAESPTGPWSEPIEIPRLTTGWDWNTDLTIHPDGSAVALIRAGYTWHATNYADPTTWHPVGVPGRGGTEGPAWDGVTVEDPYIWRQGDVYHALAHAFAPFYGVHAVAPVPPPGFDWNSPLHWTVTGVAYGNRVEFADGSSRSFSRRERPHLVWAPPDEGGVAASETLVALSNGVQFAGRPNQAHTDGVFTLLQPVRGGETSHGTPFATQHDGNQAETGR